MKYFLIPVAKFLFVVFAYIVCMPVCYVAIAIMSLWHWNLKGFAAFKEEAFIEEDYTTQYGKQIEYYVYQTGLDYLKGRKTYKTFKVVKL